MARRCGGGDSGGGIGIGGDSGDNNGGCIGGDSGVGIGVGDDSGDNNGGCIGGGDDSGGGGIDGGVGCGRIDVGDDAVDLAGSCKFVILLEFAKCPCTQHYYHHYHQRLRHYQHQCICHDKPSIKQCGMAARREGGSIPDASTEWS